MKSQRRKKRLDPNTVLLIPQIVGGLLVLMLLGIIIVSIWYGTRMQGVTITEVDVTGGQTIPHESIEKIASQKLEGSYIGLIPRQFSFMYPKSEIIADVSKLDRIKTVVVERDSLTKIVVALDEFIPESLWCSRGDEKCVFLDQTGYAFAPAPNLSGGSFLRLGKLGVEPVTGIQAFSLDTYEKIKALIEILEDNDWFVSAVEIDVANDAYLTLSEGGELKVTLKDEPEQIVENLFTVLNSQEFSGLEVGNFEYIDLRFGNKVFVNELEPEPEAGLASSSEDELE